MSQVSESAQQNQPVRKAYRTPALREFGTVAGMTAGGESNLIPSEGVIYYASPVA